MVRGAPRSTPRFSAHMKHKGSEFAEPQSLARIVITDRAKILLKRLKERHGPLLFHQSGGCCDGGAPLCLPREEFRVGARDVLLDVVEGTPFYIDELHFQIPVNEKLLLDVVASQSDSFSLECSDEMRFVTSSFDPAECSALSGTKS
jgi:uncharacterized protein (DUF779 family)